MKKTRLMLVAGALAMFAVPTIVEAQGVVQGGTTGGRVGARAGNRALGPVGGFVGGVTGAVAGGIAGGANGVLGNPYRGRYYHPSHRSYYKKKYH